jgi:hypothetical protein
MGKERVMTAQELFDRNFLEMRHRLLDLAAALDRIDRGDDSATVRRDARWTQLQQALNVLLDGQSDRAERVQMVFSIAYDPAWREA